MNSPKRTLNNTEDDYLAITKAKGATSKIHPCSDKLGITRVKSAKQDDGSTSNTYSMARSTEPIWTENHEWPKVLIFDIGGIILDDSDQVFRERTTLTPDKRETLEQIVYGPGWYSVMIGETTCAEYISNLCKDRPEYAPDIELMLGAENFETMMPLYAPNIELLKELNQTGKYQMYWLSNMIDTEYASLTQQGIINLLDGGAFSCQEHCKKPEEKFYRRLLERYQLDPRECVFFDDKPRNLAAGERLGIKGELVSELAALKEVVRPYFRAVKS